MEIFKIYKKIKQKYGEIKDISGFLSTEIPRNNYLKCIEIIKNARGRNIVLEEIDLPDGAFYSNQNWEYSGEIDPNFDWDDFWNSIFDFTYDDFLKEVKEIEIKL